MSTSRSHATSVRLVHPNRIAILVVAGVVVFGTIGLVVLLVAARQQASRKVMAVARQLREAGHPEMVIRHLNQYLATEPADVEALVLRAEVIVELAQGKNASAILAAAKAQEALIRADPEGPEAQKARRRLVALYTRYGDIAYENANTIVGSRIAMEESRYSAAERTARELIAGGADDPEAHRLLALALEGQAVPGNTHALDAAIKEFRTVLIEDPKDRIAAEHLAALYRDRSKDVPRADNVLDDLLQALPDAVDVRLIRYRHFLEAHRPDKAATELAAAIARAPDDLNVILAASEDAFRRGETAQARAYLAKVPESSRSELRVLMLRGMIDFGEEHPDEAVESWRKCLMTSAGTDAETSWWLAYALIQIGRVAEAKPLIGQYRRLAGLESPKLRFLEAVLDEKTGRPARAILMIEQIKERFEPQWEEMIDLTRGRCYEALWDEHKAAEAYTLAIENEPTSVVPRLALANLRLKRRPDDAILELERALNKIPNHPALKVALAGALLRREAALPKTMRSFTAFDRAWAKAKASTTVASALILMQADRLAMVDQEADAVALLEKAAADNPKSAPLAVGLADGLNRLGKPELALAVVDRASDPKAAGDQASLRIARARALIALYRGREARAALVQSIDGLPPSERPPVWIALGQLETGRGDPDGARRAYTEWAKLVPDDPRPRLVLVELAIDQGDLTAAHARVEELRFLGDSTATRSRTENAALLGGTADVAYRLGRVKELIAEYDDPDPSEHTSNDPLAEATTLVDAVLLDAPVLPAAQMARAQILERRGKVDEAIASYERAWENGVDAALPRIVELLTRRGRFDALAKLRSSATLGSTTKLDLLSAQTFVRVGDRTQAGKIANQIATDMPESTQALGWQVRMLDHLGRIDDAESALLAMADRRPNDIDPLLDLLKFQASRHREVSASATAARIKAQFKTSRPERLDAVIARARGDYDAAAKAYAAAIERDPNDLLLLFEAAGFYEQAERSLDAEAAYRQVLALDAKNRPAARQLAMVLAHRANASDWAKAWEALGPESASDDPEDRLARAFVLSRSSEPTQRAQALPMFDNLLADLPAKNPTAARARKLFMELLLDVGKNERAAQIGAISASDGTDPGAIALYAQALLQSKNPTAAEWQLDRLSAVSPGDLRETSLRAKLIWDRSRPVEAATALERAYQIRENTPGADALGREAFLLLAAMGHETNDIAERLARSLARKKPIWSWMPATILARKGLKDEALALLKTAVRPGATAEDLREVGRCAMQVAVATDDSVTLGKVAAILTSALELQPNSDELLVMTAMLRHLQSDYKEEVRLYKSVLTRRPESYVVLMNLAWALSEGLHRPEEALPYMETLSKLAGGDIAVMDTHAVILMRLKRYEEAIRELRAVVDAKPSALHYFHQALAYKRAGHADEAQRCLDDARKAGLNVREVDVAERDDFRDLVEPVTVGQAK